MSHVTQCRRPLTWGAVAAVALLLGRLAGPALAQPYADPVWQLQQALQVRKGEGRNPAALKVRDATLKKIVERLKTVSELRRALTLTGWRDQTDELTPLPMVGKGADKLRGNPLANVDREIRKDVGERLAKRLEEAATRGDVTTKLAVAQLLEEMGTNVRSTGEVQMGAEKYADRRGYTRRFGPLLAKLTRDPSPAVRTAAARALGKTNPDMSVAMPALKTLVQHDAVTERRAAVDAMLSMVREINKLWKKGRTQTGVEAGPGEVLEVCTAVVPVTSLAVEDRDTVARRQSLATLVEAATSLSSLIPEPYDSKEVPPRNATLTLKQVEFVRLLYKEIQDKEKELAPLAKALADQGERLARALNDADPEVRLLAERTLEYIANARLRLRRLRESLPELDAAAEPATSSRLDGRWKPAGVVLAAAQDKKAADEDVLRRGVTPALTTIAKRLQDPDPVIRRTAVDFLEMLEDAAAPVVPALIGALGDADIFVRWSAARTLGRIDPALAPGAAAALAKLLTDRDLDVRLTAAASLEAYGPAARAAVPALAAAVAQGDPEFRRAVMYALQSIGPVAARETVPGLITDLAHEDARVRRTAAETLGRFGTAARSAIPALRQALQDEDADVRQAAGDALLSVQ